MLSRSSRSIGPLRTCGNASRVGLGNRILEWEDIGLEDEDTVETLTWASELDVVDQSLFRWNGWLVAGFSIVCPWLA
jgi:hypothetical protein